MRPLVCAVASAMLVLSLTSGAGASPLVSGASFAQVDFTYPGASQPDSPYGQIFLDYSQIPGSGYVNVVTSVGWVVQNMPVFGGSGLPGLSMMFELGFSGPQITSFEAIVDYSLVPLPDDSTISGLPQNFGFLPHVEHNAQGGGYPLSAPPGDPTGKMTTTFDPMGVTSPPVLNTASPSVEQDENQCGPGAVANSLAYLNDRYGVPLAHAHQPGIAGVPANSLVGQIDVQVPRAAGDGVFRLDLLDGKLKYLDLFGPHALSIRHQGIFDDAASNVLEGDRTQGRETSKFKGKVATLPFLMEQIHHGEDVEMDLTFDGDFGAGHVIMITGGDTILGRPYVTFVHDAEQDDNTKGTGLFDGGYGFAWLEDPGGGARMKFKGYLIGSDNLNAEVRNLITESVTDHFECYEAHGNRAVLGVPVTDAFGPSVLNLKKPKRLCNPASKNDEAPGAQTHPDHLTGYQIKQVTPKFVKVQVSAANQFGTSLLRLVKPDYFFVPTAKSLTGPPSPLGPAAVDHFKCYRAKGAKTVIPVVNVVDQFGTFMMSVKKPMRLCLAANKNGEGVHDPDGALMCYKVVTAPGQEKFRGPTGAVFVDDQFGANTFIVNHHRELCVPTTVNRCGDGVLGPGEACDPPADDACPGQCTATCTCAPPPPCGVDILVDTDRNNGINDDDEDDKSQWTPARGAFYIVNADDDDGDGKADGAEFGKVVGAFDAEAINVTNTKIENNNDDLKDITPIVIRKFNNLTNKTIKLRVSDVKQIQGVHVFEKIEKNKEKFWGGPTEAAVEKDITAMVSDTADVTMGLEGLKFRCVNTAANTPFPDASDMLFAGYVQLELECTDNVTGAIESDHVLLKVAPVLMLPNSRKSREVYVQNHGVDNKHFRDTFKNNLPANHVKEYTTDTQWAQDDIEIGYTQTPRSSMSVTLYTRHHGSALNQGDNQVPVGGGERVSDAKFMRQYLLAKDRGIYRNPGFADALVDSFDYGGNLELLPPTGKHELGRINFGKDMSAKKRQFLASQEVQPTFEVDTKWLSVGHVDEFIAYVKEAGGGENLTVILASPDKAWAIIDPPAPPPAPLTAGGPPIPDDPGVLFAKSATGGVPLTLTGTVFGSGASTLVDPSQNFSGSEPYQYVRIYDGAGMGQIAHVEYLLGDTITVDRVWDAFEPSDFLLGTPTAGAPCAGLKCVFYAPPSGSQWFSPAPSLGSKYILIEDTEFWRSSATTSLSIAPGSSVARGPAPTPTPIRPGDTPAAVTFKEAKDFPRFKKVNELAQAKITAAKNAIIAQALNANGTPATITFKEVPVLYAATLVGAVGSETLDDRTTFAWSPGAANIQFANKPGAAKPQKLFVAKQVGFKTDGEKFQPAINTEIGGLGEVLFPDDLTLYHAGTGEVHCGSNVLREPYDFKWWTKQPATVPSLP